MPVLSSDAFTGTNGVTLPAYAASRWAVAPGGDENLYIQTNTAGSGSTLQSGAVNIEVAWPADQYTQAVVGTTVCSGIQLVTVRHSPTAHKTFYGGGHVQSETGNARYRICKFDGYTYTDLLAHGSQVVTAGDVVRLEIQQLELVLTVNAIEILRVTDSVLVLWTGNSGLYASHSASGVLIWDTYEAGTPDSAEPTGDTVMKTPEKGWS